MKLNHIDLQVPDVPDAAQFFVRWLGFVLESNPKSLAIAILRSAEDFVLVLQRAKEGDTYPDGFHIGFLVPLEETVLAFHRRAREAGLEISDVLRNGRGVLTYCRGPGRILIEVSHPRAR